MIVPLLAALLLGDGPADRQRLVTRLDQVQDARVLGLSWCAANGTTPRVCGMGEIKKCQACALVLECPTAKTDVSKGPFAPPVPKQRFDLQLEVGGERLEQPTEKLPASAREYTATLRLLPSNITLDLADTVITYFRPAQYFGSPARNFVPVAALGPRVIDSICKAALAPPKR